MLSLFHTLCSVLLWQRGIVRDTYACNSAFVSLMSRLFFHYPSLTRLPSQSPYLRQRQKVNFALSVCVPAIYISTHQILLVMKMSSLLTMPSEKAFCNASPTSCSLPATAEHEQHKLAIQCVCNMWDPVAFGCSETSGNKCSCHQMPPTQHR